MPTRWRRGRDWSVLVTALFLTDACAVVLGFVAAGDTVLRPALTSPAGLYYQELTAVTVPVFLLIFAWQGLYDPDRLLRGASELSSVVRSCVYGLVVLVLIGFAEKHQVSRQWTVWSPFLAGLLVIGERLIVRLVARRLQRGGHLVTRALLIGADAQSVAVARQLGGANSGFCIVGVLDDYVAQGTVVAHGLRVLGGSGALSQVAKKTGATEAIVVPQALPWETLQALLAEAMAADGVRLHLSAGFYDLLTAGVTLTERNHVPLATVERVALTPFEAAVKRTFDCLLAIFLLVALSPAYVFTAVRLARSNRGEVLERRQVVGRDGRNFELLAFRAGPQVRHELVRKLPGLVNVLRGELSIVGPRPLAADSERQSGPQRLGNLRPGLTGLWRQAHAPTEQQILDLYYIRGYSIWLDLQVLVSRVWARFDRRLRRESQLAVQRSVT
jgi:lipopolysaccharide/colanic/teichoic acid biosynthesis glycosyltransferase